MASDRFIRDSSTPHNELEDVKEISTQTSTQTSREPHYENGDKDQIEPKQTSLDVHIHKLSTNETSSAGGVQARIKSPDGQKNARYSWRVGNWKIVALCLAVTVPMIAFTATILWLVFAHLVADTHCPHEELCPANGTFEGNRDDGYYYVDYAAARLAFVSSWSSTISLSLVGFLMALYSYFVAAQLIKASIPNQKPGSLPSPHRVSVLLRMFNAEILILCTLCSNALRRVFWNRQAEKKRVRQPRYAKFTVIALASGLVASFLIQAADTYLHVTTESIEMVQIQSQPNSDHLSSRGLAPWCLNSPTFGSTENTDFWSCGLKILGANETPIERNSTEYSALGLGISSEHSLLDYVDSDGTVYSLVGPQDASSLTDWHATSFATSVKCQTVQNSSCAMSQSFKAGGMVSASNFTCTKEATISGTVYGAAHQMYSPEFHAYFKEPPPFQAWFGEGEVVTQDDLNAAANLSSSDARNVFKNPFSLMSFVNMYGDTRGRLDPNRTDPEIFSTLGASHYMQLCNVTVWDLNYTVIASQVTGITKRQSNSSMTGIASMVNSEMWGLSSSLLDRVVQRINYVARSMEDFKRLYAQGVAWAYAVPLATQLSARPALSVQTRSSKIVSKVPKSALWLLIVANFLFAALAIALTILALSVASADVHQLHARLNVVGLTAQLFEGDHAEGMMREEEDLFGEHSEQVGQVKRVGVSKSTRGGVRFVVMNQQVEVEQHQGAPIHV